MIFLFFPCYNFLFTEKYIVIRIPDGNSEENTGTVMSYDDVCLLVTLGGGGKVKSAMK